MVAPRLDPKKVAQIVKLVSRGSSYREVGEILGVNFKTVAKYYNEYLDQMVEQNRKPVEKARAESAARHLNLAKMTEQIAEDALADPDKPDRRGAAAHLAIAQRAYQQLDKITGVEAALKIEATVEITQEQAQQLARLIQKAVQIAGFDAETKKKLFSALREAQATENNGA